MLVKAEVLEWNAAVIEYSLHKPATDTRTSNEIQCVGKVGSYFQPWHTMCEAPGCYKMDQRDVDGMQLCPICEMVRVSVALERIG